jgi:hypothetical protein
MASPFGGDAPMPKGPQGQKRKADVIGNAVLIGKIATGEESETVTAPRRRVFV